MDVTCPQCRAVFALHLPVDVPTNAHVPVLCPAGGHVFQHVVGRGLPLVLARVRLWILALPSWLLFGLVGGFLYAGWLLYRHAGIPGVSVALGVFVALAGCRRYRAVVDVTYGLFLTIGTATATVVVASFLGMRPESLAPLAGFLVALTLILTWFGAPAAEWTPLPHLMNTQYGGGTVLDTANAMKGTGL